MSDDYEFYEVLEASKFEIKSKINSETNIETYLLYYFKQHN